MGDTWWVIIICPCVNVFSLMGGVTEADVGFPTDYLFTKPYFLWFLNIFMMFTYLKLSMFVSSTGQSGQVKYYHFTYEF
jgi:hypothetical protein